MKGRYFIILAVSMLLASCSDWFHKEEKGFDRVMILYSAGFNTLSNFLQSDITDLKRNYLPAKAEPKALVVVSHSTASSGDYATATDAYIIRLYRKSDQVICDTLRVIPSACLTKAPVMNEALSYVKETFKSEHYGMIFSSHGTGWLPGGYYDNPVPPSSKDNSYAPAKRSALPAGAYPYHPREMVPGEPLTKSVGQEYAYVNGTKVSYEMTLEEFAANIPMKLDYLLFDTCLMGGIEVAYELKDVASYIGFSVAEVLQDGFDYTTMASHLLENTPSPQKVCEDYFAQYEHQSGLMQSATISLVDCSRMEPLADICSELIETYGDVIASLNYKEVQPYYRSFHHWFFDLEDVFLKAGITDAEKNRLESALDNLVVYKAATPRFWGQSGFEIKTYSGLSMYIPSSGDAYLNSEYKSLAWNKAVHLVQ